MFDAAVTLKEGQNEQTCLKRCINHIYHAEGNPYVNSSAVADQSGGTTLTILTSLFLMIVS